MAVLHVHIHAVVVGAIVGAIPGDANVARLQIEQAALSLTRDRFGEEEVPADPIIHRELLSGAPLVLCVKEPAPLTLGGVGVFDHSPVKGADIAEHESGITKAPAAGAGGDSSWKL